MHDLSLNFADLEARQRYKLLCGLVVPRPIALVTTLSPDGVVNAAPFSFVKVFSESPALIVLDLQHNPDGTPKDTTRNIHVSGEFVVNLVDEAMDLTAIDFPSGECEPIIAGLELSASIQVKPPRLAAVPAAFECRRRVGLAFGPQREVLGVHVRAGIADPETLDVDFAPCVRSAGLPATPMRASATCSSSGASPTPSDKPNAARLNPGAALAVDPFYTIALGDPTLESIGLPYLSVQPSVAVAQYVATEEFLAKNPETIKRFNAALQSGIEWVSKHLNSKEAHELLSSYTKINPGLLAKMAPMVDPPRKVDAQSIGKTIALMKSHDLLKGEVSVDALLAPSAR